MTTAATLAALDAVQESAAALATAVQDAKDALGGEPSEFTVGQYLTADQARSLPDGAQVKDKDGDLYEIRDGNFRYWAGGSPSFSLSDYEPITLTKLPEPARAAEEPAAEPLKAGDEVRITGLTIYDVDRIGETGTVKRVDSDNYIAVEIGSGYTRETRVYARANIEKTAPTKLELSTIDEARTVHVAPDVVGRGVAYLDIAYGHVWLSRDEALKIAAALTAIANA